MHKARMPLEMEFPYEIQEVDPETNKRLLEDFNGERTGFLQVGKEKYFFPSKYATEGPQFYNFEPRKTDTWVITYPRSGTTWTQELVWLIANDLDYSRAAASSLDSRFPFLEFPAFVHEEVKAEALADHPERAEVLDQVSSPTYLALEAMTGPRFIKTHLPFSLLSPRLLDSGCKVVYVARNPKDVAVSFFHLNRLIKTQGYSGDFNKYWNYFENNLHPWAPYWSHIKEGWDKAADPNVLFLFYEDMNKDLKATIRKVAKFLEKEMSNEDVQRLSEHLSFENFRQNPSVNWDQFRATGLLMDGESSFVRKGTTGSWKEMFTPELNSRADSWIQENLKTTDLRFPSLH